MKKYILLPVVCLLFVLNSNAQTFSDVTSQQFKELISQENGIVLDVRTSGEYSRGHIENSTLISTNDPNFVSKAALLQKDKPIYVYCLSGSRSRAVASYLVKNGYSEVYNLQRGMMDWQRNGYPVVKSETVIADNSKIYTKTDFNKLVSTSNLVLVDFYATWCAPCKKMLPVMDRVRSDYHGKTMVEKVDVQANKELAEIYDISSIPGLVLFKNGKEVWKHTGMLTYDEISQVLEKYL